jgi:hypothetical protein
MMTSMLYHTVMDFCPFINSHSSNVVLKPGGMSTTKSTISHEGFPCLSYVEFTSL